MNSLIQNTKHLTLLASESGPELGLPNAARQDQVGEVSNFEQPPLTIPRFALLPAMYFTGTATTLDPGAVFVHRFNWSDLKDHFGVDFSRYRYLRFNMRFTLQIRTSWNKTGLVGLVWAPDIGQDETNSNVSWTEPVTHLWYSSPTYRSIARIGPDCNLTVDVPWLSPFSSFLFDERNPSISPAEECLDMVASLEYQRFSLWLVNLTPIRTVSTDTFSYDYILWGQPIDISVGGLMATPTVPPVNV